MVGRFADAVGIQGTYGVTSISFRAVYVFSTLSDCASSSGLDWTTLTTFSPPLRIPKGVVSKTYAGVVKALLSDCPFAYMNTGPTMLNGAPTPYFVTYSAEQTTLVVD